MKSFLIFSIAAATLVAHAAAFRNLGFDEAQTNNVVFYSYPSGIGSVSDLLPGWELFQGDFRQTNVFFDGGALNRTTATVVDQVASTLPIEGSYAVAFWGTEFNAVPFSLAQQGDVPVGASILQFRYQENPFSVSINGVLIPRLNPLPLSPMPQMAFYDIAAFAGQNVELRVITLSLSPLAPFDAHNLDSIQFVMAPTLEVRRSGRELIVSWPAAAMGYVLESVEVLASGNGWKAVPMVPVLAGAMQSITTELREKAQFYRLVLGKSPD